MDERIFALLTWHIYYCVDPKDMYNKRSDNAAIMLLLARMEGKKDTAPACCLLLLAQDMLLYDAVNGRPRIIVGFHL